MTAMSKNANRARMPVSGKIIAADGQTHNIVDLLGGGSPICDEVYDIASYAPASGLVIGSDGKLYDLTKLLAARGEGGGGSVSAGSVTYGNGSNVAAALDHLIAALDTLRAEIGNISATLDAILGEVVE